jgi:tetratricopeptide (TPR) repeat protein
MRRYKHLLTAAILTPLLIVAPAAVPAAGAQETPGSIHGHVQEPVGIPMGDGIITLAAVGDKVAKYTFKTDANGDYKGAGIAPGSYSVLLRQPDTPPDKVVDEVMEVKIAAGADAPVDFDLTRADYIAKLPPDQRKAVEDVRAKNAAAMKENSVIKNLNANLVKARDDNKAKNYTEAESLMSQATQAKPDAPVLWLELGVAQSGLKKYDDAATSLKKAIELDAASKKPNPEIQGAAGNALGEVYATQKKSADSQAAYEAAAKVNPTQAGMYYQNETIVLSRLGDGDATVAAADKAIATDPTKPIPYYLKGQALINKATVDPKTQKIVAPPGCAEAYQKYLELAPDGQFANDAKAVLAEMGQTVKSSYKAKK